MTVVTDTKEVHEACVWLSSLKKDISKVERAVSRTNLDHKEHIVSWDEAKRQLTNDELARIKELAKHFVVQPVSTCFGFNFGVVFYKKDPVSLFATEIVFSIDGTYLPETCGQKFDDAWRELSPLSHNKENARALLYSKMETLKEKADYFY